LNFMGRVGNLFREEFEQVEERVLEEMGKIEQRNQREGQKFFCEWEEGGSGKGGDNVSGGKK